MGTERRLLARANTRGKGLVGRWRDNWSFVLTYPLFECVSLNRFSQECLFNKSSANTGLRVFFDEVLRLYNCNACCRRCYFNFNGREGSAPASIDGVVYMANGRSDIKDLYRVRQIEGVCEKVHKGNVCVGF